MTISWAYQLTEILACYFNTTLRIYVQKCWSSPNTVGWHQKINLCPNRWQNTWKELPPLGPRVLPLRQVILKGDNCSKHCIPIWNCTSMLPFSSVQLLSRVRLFATPWIAARQASLSITNSWNSPKLVHQIDDAIQPSHPLTSPSPPAPNPSQHQGLFLWINSSHEVAKVLEFQLQHQSFQWTPRTDLL